MKRNENIYSLNKKVISKISINKLSLSHNNQTVFNKASICLRTNNLLNPQNTYLSTNNNWTSQLTFFPVTFLPHASTKSLLSFHQIFIKNPSPLPLFLSISFFFCFYFILSPSPPTPPAVLINSQARFRRSFF